MDDVAVGREQAVCFDFLEGERDGFLTERTSYLLERKELISALVLNQIDIGEAALRIQLIRFVEMPCIECYVG